jgi:twitching motility two-component system response regulator PilH
MAKILVIDDSSFQQKIIKSLLSGSGHELLFATNGKEGLNLTDRSKPDLVIADLLMPDLDGYTYLEQVRKRSPSLPVIVLTSDIQETTRRQCMQLGAAAFLNKPASKETLISAIDAVLAGEKA